MKLGHYLTANVFDLLVVAMIPAPLVCNRLEVMGDRPPGLLPGL